MSEEPLRTSFLRCQAVPGHSRGITSCWGTRLHFLPVPVPPPSTDTASVSARALLPAHRGPCRQGCVERVRLRQAWLTFLKQPPATLARVRSPLPPATTWTGCPCISRRCSVPPLAGGQIDAGERSGTKAHPGTIVTLYHVTQAWWKLSSPKLFGFFSEVLC